jgi:DNA-binding protein YbaB
VTDPRPAEVSLARLRVEVAEFPRRLAEATERADQLVNQLVVGRAGDGAVTVVATGAGLIREVRLPAAGSSDSLAGHVRDAANAALESADALRSTPGPAESGVDQALDALDARLDSVLALLDDLAERLDDLAES